MLTKNLFVVITSPNCEPFQLGLEPKTWDECNRAIAWQRIGQGEFDGYSICRRIGPAEFEGMTSGRRFVVTRGCYAIEAWDNFLSTFKSV